ncbi:carbohydrate ABC transporter permease [Leucobacter sp. M11]|uniref:carbohydrate ABC transporter permease n=1 Tax=Leucobacter sp. M11 TaxID=2993565 RepID=UPI002D810E6D|nr:sugar ABC transporter permease [Leucobacter sp. M11]MEB4614569.1 sugar ABC transporter permease [Leucobacter sp. M11]
MATRSSTQGSPPPAVRPGPSSVSERTLAKPRRNWTPYLFIAPALIYLAIFLLVPLARGIQLSFTDTKLVNPGGGSFVGVDNYTQMLTSEQFWNSFLATVLYTVGTVVFAVLIGTALAVLINRPFRGRTVVRAILTFPYAMPTVAVALIFVWIYNQSSGALNRGIGVLGLGEVGWLTDPAYGMFSVVLATVWKVFPFVMLVVLASLQSVPEELFEATRIDGADGLSTFRAIVLPHIMPTVRIVALLMTIWSIRRFEIIYLLTGGGPVESTNTLVINIYRQAFSSQNLGLAATIGVLGLILSLSVTVFFLLVERRENKREASA